MAWLSNLRLRSSSPQTRRKAIESLTADDNTRTAADAKRIKPLLKSARNPDPAVRLTAVAALGKEPNSFGTEPLLDRLCDADPRVRLAAAEALRDKANPAHLTHFLTLLADKHFEVRITAIQFLSGMGEPTVAQAIVPHLTDSDADVRLAAAKAVGALRNALAIEPLVLSLTDEEPAVRHAAAAALERIDPRWVRTNAAQSALPRLEALRGDERPWIVAAAEKVLDKLNAAKGQDTEVWKRESGIRNL